MKQYLEGHGMYMDKRLLKKPEHASLRQVVDAIINSTDSSALKSDSIQRLNKRVQSAETYDEATVLGTILPCIIRSDRTLSHSKVRVEELGLSDILLATDEDFEESGMDFVFDQKLTRNFMPNLYLDTVFKEDAAKAQQEYLGIKCPKPDRVYGLSRNAYARPSHCVARSSTLDLMEVVPTLHHPFYLIESESSNGNTGTAEFQASCGGATIVHAARLLLEQTGQNDQEEADGIDQRTFIFSTTLDSSFIKFWVHFAVLESIGQTQQKRVTYHMEHLRSVHFLVGEGNLAILRRICYNILDWGVRGRDAMLRQRCSDIWRFEDAWVAEKACQSEVSAAKREQEARDRRPQFNAAKLRKMALQPHITGEAQNNGNVFIDARSL
ncbi:MAG: hypothetical protein OHK93_006880 [Ramalina farinacea]|uniref:DUF7924 domain-containing protein n=1 Tax=Ramalina farinacea TaxID=258253 RepID=A0AA43QNP5_9LECA|nr:hypothetical protein [Ramalina farinacea]